MYIPPYQKEVVRHKLTRAHVLSFLLNDWEEFKGNIYVKNM
jgi:hypothetical protein